MLTTLAAKIVVKTVTKASTATKFEFSKVQTLSKENSKCQGAKNAAQIAPPQSHFFTSTVYGPTSFHPPFPGTPKVFQTPNYMEQVKGRICERLFSALPLTKPKFSSTHHQFFLLSYC
jgi:hypothetical protein